MKRIKLSINCSECNKPIYLDQETAKTDTTIIHLSCFQKQNHRIIKRFIEKFRSCLVEKSETFDAMIDYEQGLMNGIKISLEKLSELTSKHFPEITNSNSETDIKPITLHEGELSIAMDEKEHSFTRDKTVSEVNNQCNEDCDCDCHLFVGGSGKVCPDCQNKEVK